MPRKYAEGVHMRSLAMPDDLWELARLEAEANGESVAAVIRRALEQYLRAPGNR